MVSFVGLEVCERIASAPANSNSVQSQVFPAPMTQQTRLERTEQLKSYELPHLEGPGGIETRRLKSMNGHRLDVEERKREEVQSRDATRRKSVGRRLPQCDFPCRDIVSLPLHLNRLTSTTPPPSASPTVARCSSNKQPRCSGDNFQHEN